MSDLKEKLENLTKQYKEVAEQFQQSSILKTKLEGAIEFTQMLMKEEEEGVEDLSKKKDSKK
tara:strand:+ start:294 stop:479 length:186 start_codon:yes stop_codon:yes gene_type:complete